jgi:predicted glycosyltransferase involved in capsule biosynthesis
MITLKDVTFMIPLKVESEDRKRIIVLQISYLLKNFNTNIIICEEGKVAYFPKLMKPEWNKKITYIFRKNDTELFHKTKNLNLMARKSSTPIIVSLDSDVLFHPHQYTNAAQLIRSNVVDFCYPFNQPNHNIPLKFHNQFALTLSLNGIEPHIKFEHPMPPPGGCFFMNKEKFIQGGMENEHFLSWGPEDVERRDRFIKLGYRVASCDGKLFHLDHSRTFNSDSTNPRFNENEVEYKKIKNMNKDQLLQYIGTWGWTK